VAEGQPGENERSGHEVDDALDVHGAIVALLDAPGATDLRRRELLRFFRRFGAQFSGAFPKEGTAKHSQRWYKSLKGFDESVFSNLGVSPPLSDPSRSSTSLLNKSTV
jgi:hypothetical protein